MCLQSLTEKFVVPFLLTLTLLWPGIPPLATAQQAPVDQPRWDEGDHWTWHRTSGADITYTVLKVTPEGYSVHARDTSTGIRIILIPLNLAPEDAHFFYFRWPLEPGKKWTRKVTGQLSGRSMTWTVTHTVVGQELVEVPAGRFDAVRISGRHCNDTVGGCGDFAIWYAPKVKYGAKITWFGTQYWLPDQVGASQLLISYEVRSP